MWFGCGAKKPKAPTYQKSPRETASLFLTVEQRIYTKTYIHTHTPADSQIRFLGRGENKMCPAWNINYRANLVDSHSRENYTDTLEFPRFCDAQQRLPPSDRVDLKINTWNSGLLNPIRMKREAKGIGHGITDITQLPNYTLTALCVGLVLLVMLKAGCWRRLKETLYQRGQKPA